MSGPGNGRRDLQLAILDGDDIKIKYYQQKSIYFYFRVAKMRSTTSCHNTVLSILYADKLDNVEAIK